MPSEAGGEQEHPGKPCVRKHLGDSVAAARSQIGVRVIGTGVISLIHHGHPERPLDVGT